MVAYPARSIKRRSYWFGTMPLTPPLLGPTRQPSLRSTSDPIDSRFPLNATQWCVELFDVVARQQLADGGGRIESFRETDLVRVGE
jgi:hypothetical protein